MPDTTAPRSPTSTSTWHSCIFRAPNSSWGHYSSEVHIHSRDPDPTTSGGPHRCLSFGWSSISDSASRPRHSSTSNSIISTWGHYYLIIGSLGFYLHKLLLELVLCFRCFIFWDLMYYCSYLLLYFLRIIYRPYVFCLYFAFIHFPLLITLLFFEPCGFSSTLPSTFSLEGINSSFYFHLQLKHWGQYSSWLGAELRKWVL